MRFYYEAIMKKLLFAVLFIPSVASAIDLPDGCYVSYSNPGSCWESFTGLYGWIDYSPRSVGVYHYGAAMEAVINSNGQWKYIAQTAQGQVDQCLAINNACNNAKSVAESNLQSCSSQYDGLVGTHNALVGKYNALVAPYNKNIALIKKLRKACGSKCKKIK